jgi:D-alanine-D-alanine ligase
VLRTLALPVVVKRTRDTGASFGVWLASDDGELGRAFEEGFAGSGSELLVEEFLPGIELTTWVVDSNRGPIVYGIIEIVKPPDRPMFSHAAKRMARPGRHRPLRAGAWPIEVAPPQIDAHSLRQVEQTSLRAHRALGLRHYSRVDLILRDGVPVVLEVNAAPQLLWGSLGVVAAARGHSFGNALLSIIRGAHASRAEGVP